MTQEVQTRPKVTVIIPHWNGWDILKPCLSSLEASDYPNLEIIVVDNASSDDSVALLKREFPKVKCIENSENLGFAGGCNVGLKSVTSEYYLVLNNDTTHEPDWIGPLVAQMESDPKIAAVQPKIMSAQNPKVFDYAGGVGGLMDVLGFPFAMGRIFTTMEEDDGYYDTPKDIFWASGTALLIRGKALDEVGLFDEDFFAHMEEIDLCWRFHNAGWRVVNAPASKIYHHSGWTLPPDRFQKKYLNHRNNLMMIIKNYPTAYLAAILPARIALEGVAFVFSAMIRDWKRMGAIILALAWIFVHPVMLFNKHMETKKTRRPYAASTTQKRLYGGSIFFQYFLRGKKRTRDLAE
ncbi:MAG: glycosyltransferase family 2 protein [Candidatus Marinimicrobia bacterium]|nr:glycosyltransferase family 2 protein [Candidatus Neomarinimicrobiota bacterium]